MTSTAETTLSLQIPTSVTPVKSLWRRMGRSHWVAVAVLGLAVIVALGQWSMHGGASAQCVTVRAERGAITRTATATGTVNPVLTIIVGAYDSGVIQNIYCDYNTQVRAGQVCAKIDPRPYQATFDQYTGQLTHDQAALDEARVDLARYQKLAEQNSIARQQAEDQAFVVSQDEGTVKLDQGYLEAAKLNLDYAGILSPVDGVVMISAVLSVMFHRSPPLSLTAVGWGLFIRGCGRCVLWLLPGAQGGQSQPDRRPAL